MKQRLLHYISIAESAEAGNEKAASAVDDVKKEQLSAVGDQHEKVGSEKDAGDANRYLVDAVLGHCFTNGKEYVLIRWHECNETAWEPRENLPSGAEYLLTRYYEEKSAAGSDEKDASAVGDQNETANASPLDLSQLGRRLESNRIFALCQKL